MLVKLTIFAFLLSFLFCFSIVRFFITNKRVQNIAADSNIGPQKFHDRLTPRIGGLGIFLSSFLIYLALFDIQKDKDIIFFLLASIPAFLSGFIEDLTKRVSPEVRLISTILSAVLGMWLLGATLHRVDVPFVDNFLSIEILAYLFTLIAVSGVANSINIVDGYNGLAAIVTMLILLGIAYVSHKVHDNLVLYISLILSGSVAGFFLLNYPFGKIFLGDGGAYFIGFSIAELSILLVDRHPDVSAWFPMLLVIYPVFETLFSMYRRRLKKRSAQKPDSFHLHQLIYDRVVPHFYDIKRDEKLARNSATSPFLWFLCSMSVLPAVMFWQNTLILMLFSVLFCIFYVWFYLAIVRFKIGTILG